MHFLTQELFFLEQKELKRAMRLVEGPQGRKIVIDGKKVLNFCSNNYLGLADDGRLCRAAIESIQKDGFGSGASRLVCGNMSAHRKLEKRIAEFKGTENCLVFSTGYMANVGIISALCGRGDLILADKLNHASIIDGILLSGAAFKRYPHKDMHTLEGFLKEAGRFKKRVIVTDSVFSMDGDIAPLDEIVVLAEKYNAMVMVDEAHAFGVLGRKGKGLVEYFGLEGKVDIQMGTLSKAAGVFGAYCCGSEGLISFLLNKARSFIYTTAMPPSVAAAAYQAVDIIENEPERREKLMDHARYLLMKLKDIGFDTLDSVTPIIPIIVKDPHTALEYSQRLFDEGIFVQAIRPPTVAQNTARLRITVTATHRKEDIDYLLEHLQRIGRQLCLIS